MPTRIVEFAVEAPDLPQVDLIETDGEPLESDWHRIAMNILIDSVKYHLRHRQDFYVGGNMFMYFSEEQARNRRRRQMIVTAIILAANILFWWFCATWK